MPTTIPTQKVKVFRIGYFCPMKMPSRAPSYDLIVLGTGIAGLSTALECPPHWRILCLAKGALAESSTAWAQGGIAAVTHAIDSVAQHVHDTFVAGVDLCLSEPVHTMAEHSHDAIRSLVEWGARFSKSANGDFARALEGGHSVPRILNARDLTGREIQHAMLRTAKARPNLDLRSKAEVLELHLDPAGQISGLSYWDHATQSLQTHTCPRIVIATGGIGRLFPHTTNPSVATGDGLALALQAGASLRDLEFVQFHPTGFWAKGLRTFLISEAVRGHGAHLLNSAGERFMPALHPQAELAPRDIVARGIDAEIRKQLMDPQMSPLPHVWLDIRHQDPQELEKHFPAICEHLAQQNLHLAKDLIPVVPSAHYSCGGIAVDILGQSSVPGLFAVGEAASTGVHGANRLASNSLLEGVVFGRLLAQHLAQHLSTQENQTQAQQDLSASLSLQNSPLQNFQYGSPKEHQRVQRLQTQLRKWMGLRVGILRSHQDLQSAQSKIQSWLQEALAMPQNILPTQRWKMRLLVAQALVESALARKESRGLHACLDYPQPSSQKLHTYCKIEGNLDPRHKSAPKLQAEWKSVPN
jgi:L-aspartate oxidase